MLDDALTGCLNMLSMVGLGWVAFVFERLLVLDDGFFARGGAELVL